MSENFSREFVDEFLFKNGKKLENYFIEKTPVAKTIGYSEEGEEFNLVISNNELYELSVARLLALGVRVIDSGK